MIIIKKTANSLCAAILLCQNTGNLNAYSGLINASKQSQPCLRPAAFSLLVFGNNKKNQNHNDHMQQPQQIVEDQVADCLANLTGNEKKSVLAGLKKLHESLVKLEEKAGGETNFYDAVGRHRLQLLHNSNDIGKYMGDLLVRLAENLTIEQFHQVVKNLIQFLGTENASDLNNLLKQFSESERPNDINFNLMLAACAIYLTGGGDQANLKQSTPVNGNNVETRVSDLVAVFIKYASRMHGNWENWKYYATLLRVPEGVVKYIVSAWKACEGS